jgi:uridylate kinase
MPEEGLKYTRVLLKLSGEALAVPPHLMTGGSTVIDRDRLYRYAEEISVAAKMGVQIAVVVGGGNIFRGKMKDELKIKQDPADHMGMLATAINAIAIQSALENLGHKTRVMSAIEMQKLCEPYIQRRAVRHLEKGRIVIFAAGSGNPRFTTDTAAVMRGAEVGAEIVLKATDVEGIYDKDPRYNSDARMFRRLPYREAISRELQVMDGTAMTMAYNEENMPIRVFSLVKLGNITRALLGDELGTLVSRDTAVEMLSPPDTQEQQS